MSETIQHPDILDGHRLGLEQLRRRTADSVAAIRQSVQATHWQGNTATKVRASLADTERLLNESLNDLDQAIAEIRAHSRWTMDQRNELLWIEHRVERWVTEFWALPPEHQELSLIKPNHLRLPVRYNTAWRNVYQQLLHAGVV